MKARVGQDVLYRLTEQDAERINTTMRESGPVTGNRAWAGDLCPAKIVRTWGGTPEDLVNLQVFLDGADSYWATSRKCGSPQIEYGSWYWLGGVPQ